MTEFASLEWMARKSPTTTGSSTCIKESETKSIDPEKEFRSRKSPISFKVDLLVDISGYQKDLLEVEGIDSVPV